MDGKLFEVFCQLQTLAWYDAGNNDPSNVSNIRYSFYREKVANFDEALSKVVNLVANMSEQEQIALFNKCDPISFKFFLGRVDRDIFQLAIKVIERRINKFISCSNLHDFKFENDMIIVLNEVGSLYPVLYPDLDRLKQLMLSPA